MLSFQIRWQQTNDTITSRWPIYSFKSMCKTAFIKPGIHHKMPAGLRTGGTTALKNKGRCHISRLYLMGFKEADGQKRDGCDIADRSGLDMQGIKVGPVHGILPGLVPEKFQCSIPEGMIVNT